MKLNKNILDSIVQFENIIGYRFNNKEYILKKRLHIVHILMKIRNITLMKD